MLRTKLLRAARLAALAAVATLTFGSLAWAHNDNYYRRDQARDRGYQYGYRDGVREGRYDRMQGYRYNYKSQQWDDGDGGYEHWMGSHGQYKKAYRSAYARGYREGYGGYRNRRDRDRYRYDYDRRYDRDGWR